MTNTKTFQNLMNSFAGESQAVQRYKQYAKVAKKEGWSNIAAIFEETAVNEHYHAKEFYKLLMEMVGEDNMPEMVNITAAYPVAIKDTHSNLIFASNGEAEEVHDYNQFAEDAKEEGFSIASAKFKLIAKVEAQHSARYKKVANLLESETMLAKEEKVQWKCMKCGHIHTSEKAPGKCPICNHARGYFEKYDLNV